MEITHHLHHIKLLRVGLVATAVLAWGGGTAALWALDQAKLNAERAYATQMLVGNVHGADADGTHIGASASVGGAAAGLGGTFLR